MLQLWGKARGEGQPAPTHPLAWHCLDVAAVAARLLEADSVLRGKFEQAFGASYEALQGPLLTLIAAHDLGKVSRHFQAKVEAAWPADVLGDYRPPVSYDHAFGSAVLLTGKDGPLGAIATGMPRTAVVALAQASAYHHGQPLARYGNTEGAALLDDARETAGAMFRLLNETVNPAGLSLPPINGAKARHLSWLLSGLVNLADWVGSDTTFFPYCAPDITPGEYWTEIALPAAVKAVDTLRLAPQPVATEPTWDSMFPGWEPSPLQRMCAEMELPESPSLIIVEDVTGAGKTEAALMLTARLMARHGHRGMFVGLPTMATSNAMYSRMAARYRALYEPQADPSLVLSHGRAKLNDEFRASVWPGNGPASCRAFFADNRKCGSLADVGVGTVDQALMSVLPTRHATLRQFGLARQVLVLDEVHAYDSYMGREIERLVAFQAAHGGSVVLLSATLPQRVKEALAQAYCGEVVSLAAGQYPLVTVVSRSPA